MRGADHRTTRLDSRPSRDGYVSAASPRRDWEPRRLARAIADRWRWRNVSPQFTVANARSSHDRYQSEKVILLPSRSVYGDPAVEVGGRIVPDVPRLGPRDDEPVAEGASLVANAETRRHLDDERQMDCEPNIRAASPSHAAIRFRAQLARGGGILVYVHASPNLPLQLTVSLATALYTGQRDAWPEHGRHILAHYDLDTIIVYQAYRPAIAKWAVDRQQLGGPEFSLSRMSWIKPNFLWMMYRSGWATKGNQERILALRLSRAFFDDLLRRAVPSTFNGRSFGSEERWRQALRSSDVRLQWDPDRTPDGAPLKRRALQLGLRGPILRKMAAVDIREVIDLTAFVCEQRANAACNSQGLLLPHEARYWPEDAAAATNAELDAATD